MKPQKKNLFEENFDPQLFDDQLILEKPYVENLIHTPFKNNIKLVDLFSGIGGFHLGLLASSSKKNIGVKVVLASEIEESCRNVYKKNFGCDVQGDINKININDYNFDADILTAGFPCQPFSNSGMKKGLIDKRGQFYYKIEEFIKKFKTKSFILENVPGIKKNGGGNFISKLAFQPQIVGKTMNFIEENLKKLSDYNIRWLEIDSSTLGSPQVRKRVYIVGVHKDFSSNLQFNFKPYKKNPFMSVVKKIHIKDLELSSSQCANIKSFMHKRPAHKDGMRRVGQAYLCKGGNVGQGYHAYGLVPTLTLVWSKFMPIYFPHEKENLPKINVSHFEPNRFYGKGYFRKASINEVMKLQGFPEDFFTHEKSTCAYQHAGNSVNVKVIREIADNLLNYILK